MKVAVSRLHYPVTTLGPGRRLGLWLQGCSIRCPGCISLDTWDPTLGVADLDTLLGLIESHAINAEGLTVSGGEPFDQPDALAAVLQHWRSRSTTPVLVFTGYEIERVSAWFDQNPALIDALISGPFRSELPQTLAMRGSDNQQLHVLTALGVEMLAFERTVAAADRRLDIMFDQDGHAWMAGIPARGDLARLRRALAAAGHRVTTSAERESLTA